MTRFGAHGNSTVLTFSRVMPSSSGGQKSARSTFDAVIRGLEPGANYEVTFAETYDVKETRVMTSAALGRMRVKIDSTPGVLLVRSRKLKAHN